MDSQASMFYKMKVRRSDYRKIDGSVGREDRRRGRARSSQRSQCPASGLRYSRLEIEESWIVSRENLTERGGVGIAGQRGRSQPARRAVLLGSCHSLSHDLMTTNYFLIALSLFQRNESTKNETMWSQ